MKILVLNSGSSSQKARLYDLKSPLPDDPPEPWWEGKLFVLCLIGFVSTGFVVTITLSAADAAAHLVENPAAHALAGNEVLVTLVLIVLLGAVFLQGIR